MKLKYTFFDNREQYEEAVASDVNVASKELSDDEAVEAALNSTDGVREVICRKAPLEITLQKVIWQGKTGTMTTVDYFLEV